MWIKFADERPPAGEVVKTKIDDEDGLRNEQEMIFESNLWWLPDKSMYVYYCPTHWWKEGAVPAIGKRQRRVTRQAG